MRFAARRHIMHHERHDDLIFHLLLFALHALQIRDHRIENLARPEIDIREEILAQPLILFRLAIRGLHLLQEIANFLRISLADVFALIRSRARR